MHFALREFLLLLIMLSTAYNFAFGQMPSPLQILLNDGTNSSCGNTPTAIEKYASGIIDFVIDPATGAYMYSDACGTTYVPSSDPNAVPVELGTIYSSIGFDGFAGQGEFYGINGDNIDKITITNGAPTITTVTTLSAFFAGNPRTNTTASNVVAFDVEGGRIGMMTDGSEAYLDVGTFVYAGMTANSTDAVFRSEFDPVNPTTPIVDIIAADPLFNGVFVAVPGSGASPNEFYAGVSTASGQPFVVDEVALDANNDIIGISTAGGDFYNNMSDQYLGSTFQNDWSIISIPSTPDEAFGVDALLSSISTVGIGTSAPLPIEDLELSGYDTENGNVIFVQSLGDIEPETTLAIEKINSMGLFVEIERRAVFTGENNFRFLDENPDEGSNIYRAVGYNPNGSKIVSQSISITHRIFRDIDIYPTVLSHGDRLNVSGQLVFEAQIIDNLGRNSVIEAVDGKIETSGLQKGWNYLFFDGKTHRFYVQ